MSQRTKRTLVPVEDRCQMPRCWAEYILRLKGRRLCAFHWYSLCAEIQPSKKVKVKEPE